MALSEIYGAERGARHRGRLAFQAFSCEYIANMLERGPGAAGARALHLTRRQDLLDLDLARRTSTPTR